MSAIRSPEFVPSGPADLHAVENAPRAHAHRPEALGEAILDTALAIGEQRGWHAVHLHEVASVMGITLSDVRRCYEHKDALAEAWFDRADAALLSMPERPGWRHLTPRQRLHAAIGAWLDALAEHRGLTVEMLSYKFQPEHIHLQAQGVMRISRTVQWIRDVAALPEVGWRRELGEAAVTAIYLSTFARWLADDGPTARHARDLLDRLLSVAERAALRLNR